MKKFIQLLLVLSACAARGQGTLVYDQQVSNTNPPGGYNNIVPGPSGQSFIPSLSSVEFVQLYLADTTYNGTGAIIYVSLWSGSLTNGTLLGSTAPILLPYGFVGLTNFVFSAPLTVAPGTSYYLQPAIQSGDNFAVGIVPGSLYAKGMAYFNGAASSGTDLWFREGIIVPEPSIALLAVLGGAGFYYSHRKKQ